MALFKHFLYTKTYQSYLVIFYSCWTLSFWSWSSYYKSFNADRFAYCHVTRQAWLTVPSVPQFTVLSSKPDRHTILNPYAHRNSAWRPNPSLRSNPQYHPRSNFLPFSRCSNPSLATSNSPSSTSHHARNSPESPRLVH